MQQDVLSRFSSRVRQELFDHILPFWCGSALDHEQGGWLAWISNDLRVDRSKPKGLIVNCRILWAFSSVYRRRPEPVYRQMAERAMQVVMEQFWDTENGGAWWQLDGAGRILDASKKMYGQAFYVYALAEYYQAFGDETALQRARDLFELLEQHAFDPKNGGYWEVRARDWGEVADTRLSEKDMNEKKSMNNHLHILEAYTNLFQVWPDSRVSTKLRHLIGLFEGYILNGQTHHFHHFFDEKWQVRSETYTFGHDIEGSWLLCEAAEVLGDSDLLDQVRNLAVAMAETVLKEGLDADGGLVYEGKGGRIVDAGKECWPQAEAVVGFLNAFQLTGDPKFFDATERVWNYIENHLADRINGEWFWRINLDGQPDPDLPKVSEWKGPYHGTRACLETLRRLAELS